MKNQKRVLGAMLIAADVVEYVLCTYMLHTPPALGLCTVIGIGLILWDIVQKKRNSGK